MFKCELCAEIAGLPSRFASIYREDDWGRIILTSENFVVLPSIGQLGEGHLMIVSKAHHTAVAQLDIRSREELVVVSNRVRTWMQSRIAQHVVLFENGDPAGNGRMGCTISHLHVHLVASNRPMTGLQMAFGLLGAECIRGLDALPRLRDAYSCIEFASAEGLLVRRRLPSQTLRKVVADQLGSKRWDWRLAGQEQQLLELVRTGRESFAHCDERRAA